MFKSPLYYLVNSACCLLYKKEYKRYAGCGDVLKAQNDKLIDILKSNQSSAYGRKYGFSHIKTPEEFKNKVPLTVYEDYLPYIERIKSGEKGVLTAEDIIMLEPTSGSASASKLIPYTQSLKEEFQCGIKPWIYDLYTRYPKIKSGSSYWSVTPAVSARLYTSGGIPIGFEEDSEYFGKFEKGLMDFVFVSPKNMQSPKTWMTSISERF